MNNFIVVVGKIITVVCTNNTKATFKNGRKIYWEFYWEVSSWYLKLPGNLLGKFEMAIS